MDPSKLSRSALERFNKKRMQESIARNKAERKQRAEESTKKFHDKIGPAVEFAQDQASGKHEGKGKTFTAEDYRKHYFPNGYEE
jgi:hypothetical protein